MRKQIPNLITCMNVISGTLAIFLAMYGLLTAAAILILVGMVFDFFDGMTARLLHVKSEIGIRWPIWSVSGLLLLFWRIF